MWTSGRESHLQERLSGNWRKNNKHTQAQSTVHSTRHLRYTPKRNVQKRTLSHALTPTIKESCVRDRRAMCRYSVLFPDIIMIVGQGLTVKTLWHSGKCLVCWIDAADIRSAALFTVNAIWGAMLIWHTRKVTSWQVLNSGGVLFVFS